MLALRDHTPWRTRFRYFCIRLTRIYFFSTSSGKDAFLTSRLSLEWKWLCFLKEEQTCFLAHSDWGRGWGETSPSNGWVWLNSVYPTSFHLTVKLLEGRGYHEVVRIWPLELGKSAFAHGPRGSWGSWWNSEASLQTLRKLVVPEGVNAYEVPGSFSVWYKMGTHASRSQLQPHYVQANTVVLHAQ